MGKKIRQQEATTIKKIKIIKKNHGKKDRCYYSREKISPRSPSASIPSFRLSSPLSNEPGEGDACQLWVTLAPSPSQL